MRDGFNILLPKVIVESKYKMICCLESRESKTCEMDMMGKFFVWFLGDFMSNFRIFQSFEEVTIAGEGLQILTHARRAWPLNSESSLRCKT